MASPQTISQIQALATQALARLHDGSPGYDTVRQLAQFTKPDFAERPNNDDLIIMLLERAEEQLQPTLPDLALTFRRQHEGLLALQQGSAERPLHTVSAVVLAGGTAAHPSRGEEVTPRITSYRHLGPTYERVTVDGKERYQKTSEGIRTWEELANFMRLSVSRASDGHAVEIEVNQYNFPTMEPPQALLDTMAQLARDYPHRPIVLAVNGDPMDPPNIYNSSAHEAPAIGFWQHNPIPATMNRYFSQNPSHRSLYNALQAVHAQRNDSNLGEFLAAVIEEYNRTSDASIPSNQRTLIFTRIRELQQGIQNAVYAQNPATVVPGALYFDPVTQILRAHPANNSPENHAISVGGGAMAAQLATTRELIDRGVLPLDFRLTAVDINEDLVWEVNEHGTNLFAFRNLPLNDPQTGRPIYYTPTHQRLDYLKKHPARYVFLNLKAAYLNEALLGDDELLRVLNDNDSIIAMPAKAYDEEGRIPYLEIYKALRARGYERLANRMIVEGGFFNAADILAGNKIYMTLAGGDAEALKEFARVMTPHAAGLDIHGTGRANWDRMEIKFIESVELAAFLMAGGANKNFLTYYLARKFMGDIDRLDQAGQLRDQTKKNGLERDLEQAKQRNVDLSEEIIARLMPSYDSELATDHHSTPHGLKKDIFSCAPGNTAEMIKIIAELRRIVALDSGELQVELRALIGRIEAGAEKGGLGDGTRNARDGYIDHMITVAYGVLRGRGELADTTFETFRDSLKEWKGANAQEGRNGIGPVVRFATARNITLPREVYEAWNLYNPSDPVEIPNEQSREVASTVDDPVHAVWGLPTSLLYDIFEDVRNQFDRANQYSGAHSLGIAGSVTKDPFVRGLNQLLATLSSISQDTGQYPEITRRLEVIRQRVNGLIIFLTVDREISQAHLTQAARDFRATLQLCVNLFTDPESVAPTTTELLNRLREINQQLFRVELALDRDLRRQIGGNGDSSVDRRSQIADRNLPQGERGGGGGSVALIYQEPIYFDGRGSPIAVSGSPIVGDVVAGLASAQNHGGAASAPSAQRPTHDATNDELQLWQQRLLQIRAQLSQLSGLSTGSREYRALLAKLEQLMNDDDYLSLHLANLQAAGHHPRQILKAIARLAQVTLPPVDETMTAEGDGAPAAWDRFPAGHSPAGSGTFRPAPTPVPGK